VRNEKFAVGDASTRGKAASSAVNEVTSGAEEKRHHITPTGSPPDVRRLAVMGASVFVAAERAASGFIISSRIVTPGLTLWRTWKLSAYHAMDVKSGGQIRRSVRRWRI
jgi:hypothetical protein